MSAFEVEHLATCITAHAWNADRSRVALCPNNNEIHIFAKQGTSWVVEHVLVEHDQVVTSIDWAPKTNRIVSSSQDRNAYVWTFKDGQWKPVLVLLRINRAATHVKWSPNENKFAVASGAKLVCICFFEEEHDWWASHHIKKHKSTVLKVDWHPNNLLLATSSSDYKVRVFDAYVKVADGRNVQRPYGEIPFGQPIFEFDQCASWVHALKWSASGSRLGFSSHDSTLAVADFSGGDQPQVQKLRLRNLPLRDLLFVTENSIVGVGHDCTPILITCAGGQWKLDGELDKESGPAAGAGSTSARNVFQNKVDLGESKVDIKLPYVHQNCITTILPFKATGGVVSDFSTSGLDGNIVIWHVKPLETKKENIDRICFSLVCKRLYNERDKYLSFNTDSINIGGCDNVFIQYNHPHFKLPSYDSTLRRSIQSKNDCNLYISSDIDISLNDFSFRYKNIKTLESIPTFITNLIISVKVHREDESEHIYKLLSKSESVRQLIGCHTLKYGLPKSLESLVFTHDFNEPLVRGSLPNGLKSLHFGVRFNQPLQKGILPESLSSLAFCGGAFQHVFEPGMLPSSLKTLFLTEYTQTFKMGALPHHLEFLSYSGARTVLAKGILPTTIHTLRMAPDIWIQGDLDLPNLKDLRLTFRANSLARCLPPLQI
ncbi:actin related protein 2/3 complex [Heterostelium album PN500]|uniref:Arp2/3 complex 41 kDa subunit n=1 Tax=Heterostelium pallidum (strain ATCC 26659 / Pp 5 / PN500) TaxID=670386 RepID=D3BPL1_HETP5|nr:actin related protein 2/3 complex [Heterostelium album PN500]EFA76631.1 actin related protein 2/3 complex [Heterostelium album PN500]|eukprot:XP_020428763.1 actin related protein 2/3 complex [Heterostelium album PN500]